jgi:hypothetical protein
MKISKVTIRLSVFLVVFFFSYLARDAYAHCDGMDGPVVKAAQAALQSSNVNLVLPWVKKNDEQTIRQAFTQTLEVRKLNPAAKELADHYFFETLVRLHRAGEGASFTGLKPAGRDLGPAIPAADKAIEAGSPEAVVKLLSDAVSHGVQEHFEKVKHAKSHDQSNVEAGREYVEQYVIWVHYVNGIYEAAARKSVHHAGEEGSPPHDEE